ncbi:hypothetical protein JOM56_000538 [Amanita muscaria]
MSDKGGMLLYNVNHSPRFLCIQATVQTAQLSFTGYVPWNGPKNATLTTPSNASDTSPPLPPSSLTLPSLPPPSLPTPPSPHPSSLPLPPKFRGSAINAVDDATRRPESPRHPPPPQDPPAKWPDAPREGLNVTEDGDKPPLITIAAPIPSKIFTRPTITSTATMTWWITIER